MRGRKLNKRFKIKREVVQQENFSEKGKLLHNELEENERFAKRGDKPVAGENVFIVLTTTKPISKEHALLAKYFTFSLQTSENSAIVSINESRLQELKIDIKKYMQNEEQKTYIAPIKKISRVKINKISTDLLDSIAENNSKEFDVELSLLPNLGRGYYTNILEKINAFLETNGSPIIDQIFDNQIASIRTILKPNTLYSVIQGIDSIWQAKRTP